MNRVGQNMTSGSARRLSTILFAALLCGCASAAGKGDVAGGQAAGLSPEQCQAGARIEAAATEDRSYRIQPGDEVAIDFYLSPEFNDDVVVRPDGKLSLRVVGDMQAAGLTPPQLSAELDKAYSSELRSPGVTVHMKNTPGQRVYVEGEVTRPGTIVLQPGMTALQAVAEAGGLTDKANGSSVVLIRRDVCGTPRGSRLDLDSATNHPGGGDDAQLAARDVIVVPRSGIANIDRFIEQYVRGVLPIQPFMSVPL